MTHALYDELGPKGRRNTRIAGAIGLAVLIGLAAAALATLHARGQLNPRIWGVFFTEPDLRFLILSGIQATLEAAVIAMALSLVCGAVLAAGLLSQHQWIRLPVRAWMEVFRGLPVLLIIFFVFLGLPSFGIVIPTFWSLVIGLALYNSAVFAEIFRAGVQSLAKGQREAGLAIGLTQGQVLRMILFPQSVRLMLPAIVSQAVIVLKETSLGFIIGYTELLREGRTAVEYLGGNIPCRSIPSSR